MDKKALEVFHALMKKGWIDREEDALVWSYYMDNEVQEKLENFKEVLGLELLQSGNRLYMIPTQDNDLFLKNNVDFRRDIRADNSIRNGDLYLMNYLSIYLIYLFFGGEGNDPLRRDFISKEELIEQFSKHCKSVENATSEEMQTDYSENFCRLAEIWLHKIDGTIESQKFDHRYGIVNRLLMKYGNDEIFTCDADNLIRPTRKMKDLMPYFLRKERVAEIHHWLKEGQTDAENQ